MLHFLDQFKMSAFSRGYEKQKPRENADILYDTLAKDCEMSGGLTLFRHEKITLAIALVI